MTSPHSDAEILAARLRIVCDEFFGRPVSEELREIAGRRPVSETPDDSEGGTR